MAQHWTRAGSENWWPNISGFREIFEFTQINQVAGCREIETDTPYTIRVVDGQNLKPMVSGFDFPWEANPMTWDTLRYYVTMWQYERIHENTWICHIYIYIYICHICHICSLHINSWWNMMESRIPKWPKKVSWAGIWEDAAAESQMGHQLSPTDPENWPCLGHGANHFCWIIQGLPHPRTWINMDYIMLVVSFFVQFLILFWDGYCSEAPHVPSCGAPIRRRGAFQLEIDPGLSGPITAGDYHVAILNAISEDWIIKNNRGKKRRLSSQLAVVAQSVSLQVSSKTGLLLQRLQVHCLFSVISQAATLQRWAP